jgi:hypothetical protein
MLLPCCIALTNAQAAIAATVITKPKSIVVRESNMGVLLSQEVRRLMRAYPAARRLSLGVTREPGLSMWVAIPDEEYSSYAKVSDQQLLFVHCNPRN